MIKTVVIDMTNLMHVGYHAMKKIRLSTNNLWAVGGKCYSEKNKAAFKNAVIESLTADRLEELFESELGEAMVSAGFNKSDATTKKDDLVSFVMREKYKAGEYDLPTGAISRMIKVIDMIRAEYGDVKLIGCWDNRTSHQAVGTIYEKYLDHLRENKPNIFSEMEKSRTGIKYKGDGVREKTNDDLRVQMEVAKWVFEVSGGINVSLDGKEADHAIGALCTNARDIIIMSGDKDMKQLVNDGRNVFMLPTRLDKRGLKAAEMREEQIREAFNVDAEYVADYLAICGDGIDNIKGLGGFGPKKAELLIGKFGGTEAIIDGMRKIRDKYDSIEDMAKSVKDEGLKGLSLNLLKNFFDNIEELRFCKQMTVLDDSWGIDVGEIMRVSGQRDINRLRSAYDLLKMKTAMASLLRELNAKGSLKSITK